MIPKCSSYFRFIPYAIKQAGVLRIVDAVQRLLLRVERLNSLGAALSTETNTDRLIERILLGAKDLTNAEGGTVYIKQANETLTFSVLVNDALGIHLGGDSDRKIPFAPLPLYDQDGRPNHRNIAAYAALEGVTVNIPDAYHAEGFDFSGTRAMDQRNNYRSQSFLTVPMRNHEGELLGILQLINALDGQGRRVAFTSEDQSLAESLAAQAAVALTQQQLINAQRALFESFVQLIAKAIDEKSPHTSRHCQRIPELTMRFAAALNACKIGRYQGFAFTEEQFYELRIAAWLHDCGKITTPNEIMEKGTKLQAIFDRIELIDTRFEVVKRDLELAALRDTGETGETAPIDLTAALERLTADRTFLRHCNIGSEFMSEADRTRVEQIAQDYVWIGPDGQQRALLTENEIENLTIPKGTLTAAERQIIRDHIVVTIEMLEQLSYPRYLANVPALAGGHHERMDGRGYPNGLKGEENPLGARLMAIADIFEALTAADRPYKTGKPLSEAMAILKTMRDNGHIDPELFAVFVHEQVYRHYAQEFLHPEQIDAVDEAALLATT